MIHNLALIKPEVSEKHNAAMSSFEIVHKKGVLKFSCLPQLKKFWDHT